MWMLFTMYWSWILLATVFCAPIYEDVDDISKDAERDLQPDFNRGINSEFWKRHGLIGTLSVFLDEPSKYYESKYADVNKRIINKQSDKLDRVERSIYNSFEDEAQSIDVKRISETGPFSRAERSVVISIGDETRHENVPDISEVEELSSNGQEQGDEHIALHGDRVERDSGYYRVHLVDETDPHRNINYESLDESDEEDQNPYRTIANTLGANFDSANANYQDIFNTMVDNIRKIIGDNALKDLETFTEVPDPLKDLIYNGAPNKIQDGGQNTYSIEPHNLIPGAVKDLRNNEVASEVPGTFKDVITNQGLTITVNEPAGPKEYGRLLPHKSRDSSSPVNMNSWDRDGVMSFIEALYAQYERENSKRSIYDDGDVVTNKQEERNPSNLLRPLYHLYTGEMTLKDIYIKMGGVCTLIEGFSTRPIYVISNCPRDGPYNNIRYYCERATPFNKRFHQENIIDLIMTPVQDSSGFVYKNVYCAQCNGIIAISAWSTKLDCDHFQSVELSDGRQQVRILDQFSDKDQGCSRQLSPEIKRMIHECPLSEVINTMNMRIHDIRVGEGSQSELSPFPLSYSLLMNFGFDGKTHILFTTQPAEQSTYGNLCNDDEMYDPHGLKCRPMSCNEGYELVGRTCQKATHYESDTTSGDLFTLDETEGPFRITLTTQNLSLLELTSLYLLDIDGGLEEHLQNILSASFNISKDRIQNVTITLFNTSDAMSELTREEIIVIILSTPGLADRTSPLPTSIDNIVNVSEIDSERVSVEEIPADEPDDEDDDESLIDDSYVSTRAVSTSTVNPVYDTIYSNMSVNISFILFPAHKNRTHLEKSTKSVVKSMSEMVESNVFFITINGTDFAINSIYNASDVQTMDNFCEFGQQVDYYSIGEEFVVDMEYIPELDLNLTIIYVNESGRTYYPGQYDLTYSLDGVMGNLDNTVMECFVIVCNWPEILDEQCSRIVLAPDEYDIIREESEMSQPVVEFANHTYTMGEFEVDNIQRKTVRICAPDWSVAYLSSDDQWAFVCGNDLLKLVIAESYLTFILGLISLVCLLSVLITYSIFDKLRNLPGINTMNLTLTLFLGELVFMVSGWVQPHRWLCSTVGVVLHFLFLASFFWMNVMSYDVYCTFANKTNLLSGIRSKKKYAIRYSGYAWGCPLIIVSICSVIDFGGFFDNVAIGYGGSIISSHSNNKSFKAATNGSLSDSSHVYNIGCWIQEPIASMVAFGGPMILILFSNTVMFIRTIIGIRTNTRSTKDSIRKSSVNNKVCHDDVMLYVRMSTVMGFTWVFGLASSVVSAFSSTPTRTSCIILHLLGILFIVFNCSQGIFIFFVFVFNRRVFALYKGLYQRLKHKRKKPVSLSSSCGTLSSAVSQSSIREITHL